MDHARRGYRSEPRVTRVKPGLLSGLVAVHLLLGVGASRAATATTGSTTGRSVQRTAAEPALLPVELPDLGSMHASVQEQLREAFALLTASESRSQAYGDLGKLLLAGQYLGVAERCFRNAQMLAPDDARWPYYLAHVFNRQGDLTKAVEHFEQVLRLRPTDFPTLVWLGHVYIDLGQPEAAEPVLTRARALGPDTASVLYQLGRADLAM